MRIDGPDENFFQYSDGTLAPNSQNLSAWQLSGLWSWWLFFQEFLVKLEEGHFIYVIMLKG